LRSQLMDIKDTVNKWSEAEIVQVANGFAHQF
jgi:hypothetical protein